MFLKTGENMIYFDNSATSRPKPPEVIGGVIDGLTRFCSNPGRAGHALSLAASVEVMSVRETIRSHVGATKAENVIFCCNCTEALNYAIFGTAKPGGHIIITANEHNSVYRPVMELKRRIGVSVSICQPNTEGYITSREIERLITPKTYLVVCNHVSNVNGDESDLESIGKLCLKKNILFLVDAAQSLGHKKIDMNACAIDFLAIAGHKGLLGPQGSGALVINGDLSLASFKHGGSGTNSKDSFMPKEFPESMEAGTIATPSILGLGAGVRLIEEKFDDIVKKIEDISTYAYKEISKLNNITLYTKEHFAKNGVIAFNVNDIQSTTIADILDQKGICVRAGLHCAPLKHKSLGTLEQGVVRISFSHKNTRQEVDELIRALKTI